MNSTPSKFIPALYAGTLMGLVNGIPFLSLVNCVCCAGFLLGGILAVFFYKGNFTPDTPPFTIGDTMVVGILAGLVGAVVGTMVETTASLLFGNVFAQAVLDRMREMPAQLPQEFIRLLEEAVAAPITFLSVILSLIINAFIYSVFGLLGGLIGYSIFRQRVPVMPPPPGLGS
jgi:hypothetical protein